METVLNSLSPQTIHHISESSAIAAARRAGNNLAAMLGLNETVAGKAALVITEAATNILKHAGTGDILLRGLAEGNARGIEILAIDKGPGFANLEQAMRDGMSTAGSYGVGMGAMQRLADEFDLHADRTHGCALRMAVWAKDARPPSEWTVGSVCLPLPSEHECGDAWGIACRDEQLLIMVADGLGHGPEAARASQAAIELVRKFPVQQFVLDHIAKPDIKAGTLSPWREQIRELAKASNVFCKVSGMVTEADQAHWKAADFTPYLDVVFEAFGEDRVMFGSDWPVCLLAGEYARVFGLVNDYTAQFSAAAREKFFGGNATHFYGLTD